MVNSLAGMNRPALLWAAEAGSEAVVEVLLDQCTKQLEKNKVRRVWGGKFEESRSRIK